MLPQARQIVPLPPPSPTDLPISRPDRIRWILRNSAAGDALRVHASSQIARTLALCERFSEMSEM
jgi:hypothetical protein